MPSYRDVVLKDEPLSYWPGYILDGQLVDIVGGRNGMLIGSPATIPGVGGSDAVHFDRQPGQYVDVGDDQLWRLLPSNAGLTVEAWLRLDTLEFDDAAGIHADYIHWLGKGLPGRFEWAFRLYSLTNTAGRPNRLSFYVFNSGGGEGAGAYSEYDGTSNTVQIKVAHWMHVVGTLTPYNGWPDPPNPTFAAEGPTIFHNGKIRNGVALGNDRDCYYGAPDTASSVLTAGIAFPLVNAVVPLEATDGFRNSGTARTVVVENDNGENRTVTYATVAGNALIGCQSSGSGTAARGNAVRQGRWEIVPTPGTAPLRFATRDEETYLPGAICQIAIYGSVLPASHIGKHFRAGRGH